jgi:hypothetical protein
MSITEEIDSFIAKEGGGNIRDALNTALARIEEKNRAIVAYGLHDGVRIQYLQFKLDDILEILKNLEYINIDDFVNAETKWRYCPSCGYKEPDGHWKECDLWLALEKLKEEYSDE